MLRGQAAWMKV